MCIAGTNTEVQKTGGEMKMKKSVFSAWILGITLLLAMMLCRTDTVAAEKKTVDVMFLHDTHSHLNEFATV